ncbi:hypothetical protein [Roseomonas sp. WA12]
MTTEPGPRRPAQDGLNTVLAAVEGLAIFAQAREQKTLLHFLEEVARELRMSPVAAMECLGGISGPARD